MNLSQVRLEIDGANGLVAHQNAFRQLQPATLGGTYVLDAGEPGLALPVFAAVGGKDLTAGRVNHGGFNGAPGLEAGKQFAGGFWIVKSKCGRTVGGEYLRQDAEVVLRRRVEHDAVVNQDCDTSQQQGDANRAHDDEMKLELHREVAILGYRLHLLPSAFLAICARLKSLELMRKCSRPAASTSISNRTLPSSSLKLITPPSAVKPGVSPTLRTADPLNLPAMDRNRFFSDELTKRMWQLLPGCMSESWRTTNGLPSTTLPVTACCRAPPKGFCPRMQITIGS